MMASSAFFSTIVRTVTCNVIVSSNKTKNNQTHILLIKSQVVLCNLHWSSEWVNGVRLCGVYHGGCTGGVTPF